MNKLFYTFLLVLIGSVAIIGAGLLHSTKSLTNVGPYSKGVYQTAQIIKDGGSGSPASQVVINDARIVLSKQR